MTALRLLRRWTTLMALAALAACGGINPNVPPAPGLGTEFLTAAEVTAVVSAAAEAVDAPVAIAVTDRGGNVLAVYLKAGAPAQSVGDFGVVVSTAELALGVARTAALFSNDQAPLSSRTVRYISGVHFPPGIPFRPNAALYGIENTNRGCPLNTTFLPGKQINPARSIDGTSLGLGVVTGKADEFDSQPFAVNPGGVPLFKNGKVVGAVGVAGSSPAVVEFAALTGAVGSGLGPVVASPGVVVEGGIALPFVEQTSRPTGVNPGSLDGAYVMGPNASPGPVPDGDLIAITAGPVGGLTEQEVRGIVQRAVDTANITRAVIRLPIGERAKFAIAVADLDGRLLALHRMPDATVFSIDVAVAKARNMVYFNSAAVHPDDLPEVPAGTALTNRTLSFGGQPFFPPGINDTAAGPFFQLYLHDLANPCSNGRQPASANQNGVVFFPGSVPLYRNGVLVGGLGISGDGVEQDDFVSAEAAKGFEVEESRRADQVVIRDVRLPYLKFPRNPTL